MGLFRFQAGKKEADSSISLLLEHRQEEAAWKVEKLFPAPTTEQELIEREFQLNCLQHAAREREDIEFCFLEANNKQILEHFVAVCDDVAKSDLRTRMKVTVNGFRPLLSEAIAATGDDHKWLKKLILTQAAKNANPPQGDQHWFIEEVGHDALFLREILTELLEDVTSLAKQVLWDLSRRS